MPRKAAATYTPLENKEHETHDFHRFRDDLEYEPEIGTISIGTRATYRFRGDDLSEQEWDELEANLGKLREAWTLIKQILEPHRQVGTPRSSNCAVI